MCKMLGHCYHTAKVSNMLVNLPLFSLHRNALSTLVLSDLMRLMNVWLCLLTKPLILISTHWRYRVVNCLSSARFVVVNVKHLLISMSTDEYVRCRRTDMLYSNAVVRLVAENCLLEKWLRTSDVLVKLVMFTKSTVAWNGIRPAVMFHLKTLC